MCRCRLWLAFASFCHSAVMKMENTCAARTQCDIMLIFRTHCLIAMESVSLSWFKHSHSCDECARSQSCPPHIKIKCTASMMYYRFVSRTSILGALAVRTFHSTSDARARFCFAINLALLCCLLSVYFSNFHFVHNFRFRFGLAFFFVCETQDAILRKPFLRFPLLVIRRPAIT